MIRSIDVLFPGFSASANFGALGWGTVALIRADGWAALLDAGSHSTRRKLIPRIQEFGVEPEDIKYIFLTHLHWDHANNVDYFPDASLVISKKEWKFALESPDPAYYIPTIDHIKTRNPRLIDAEGEEIAPDVQAYLTPGHSAGSTTYVVNWGGIPYALAGDAAKNRYELQTGNAKMTKNSEVSRNSIKRILSLSNHILPGHDGWVDIENGVVVPRGGNDVILSYPEGITMGGESTVRLFMDQS